MSNVAAASAPPQQAAPSASPAMRLYRHALESILTMLNLQDLSRVLAVSRSWFAAVRSMKPIGARIQRDEYELCMEARLLRPLPPLHMLIRSPLLRHVAAIEIMDAYGRASTAVTIESMSLLAQHAPNLTSLWCSPARTPPSIRNTLWSLWCRLIRMPQSWLPALRLNFAYDASAAEINHVLTSLAALPRLQRLALTTPNMFPSDVDFGLLAGLPSLIDLHVGRDYFAGSPNLSDQHLAQCRSSLAHLQRLDLGLSRTDPLALLLQPPVTARWQAIGTVVVDKRTADLLLTLPTLTKLDLWFGAPLLHADFLSQLPLLTSVRLHNGTAGSAGPMLISLLPCTGITELDLQCGFNSAQVSRVLVTLTKLRKLTLREGLDTLQCFESGPATQTLEELELDHLDRLSDCELPHLFALKHLHSLRFQQCFTSPLDDETVKSLSPPCLLLPLLTQFQSHWRYPDRCHWQVVKQVGPSFQWMQQRITQ